MFVIPEEATVRHDARPQAKSVECSGAYSAQSVRWRHVLAHWRLSVKTTSVACPPKNGVRARGTRGGQHEAPRRHERGGCGSNQPARCGSGRPGKRKGGCGGPTLVHCTIETTPHLWLNA